MWRIVLAVILVPSLLWSQNPPVSSIDRQSAEAPQPNYQTLIQREAIRRGTSEKAALVFILANDGLVSVVSPRNQRAKVDPLRLEFDNSEGITVTDFSFPPDKTRSQSESNELRLLWPTVTIQFKVRASPKATLGERLIKGKLTYQLVRGTEVLPSQEAEIAFPLTVVEHNAVARNNAEYAKVFDTDNHTPLWLWFSLPILIPLVLVMMVVCGIRGEDCSC